jgi:hypothetical protein
MTVLPNTDAKMTMNTDAKMTVLPREMPFTPVLSLYWYKSTNTDAKMTVLPREMPFTPVLSLQVLTLLALGTRFTCFLGTKVRILTQKAKCSCRWSSISTICCADVC